MSSTVLLPPFNLWDRFKDTEDSDGLFITPQDVKHVGLETFLPLIRKVETTTKEILEEQYDFYSETVKKYFTDAQESLEISVWEDPSIEALVSDILKTRENEKSVGKLMTHVESVVRQYTWAWLKKIGKG